MKVYQISSSGWAGHHRLSDTCAGAGATPKQTHTVSECRQLAEHVPYCPAYSTSRVVVVAVHYAVERWVMVTDELFGREL